MLVEDLTIRTSQADPGRFTPQSYSDSRYLQTDVNGREMDPTVSAGFAVVSGKVPSGFRTLAEYKKGIRVQGTNKRIPYEEYKDANGQPHEIDYNGVTLREVICEREDVVAKDKLETAASNQRLAEMEGQFVTEAGHGQVQRSDYEFLNRPVEDQQIRRKPGRPPKAA